MRSVPSFPRDTTGADVYLQNSILPTLTQHQQISHETINLCLADLSSFYTYVTQTYTQLSFDGQEQPLYHYNPVKAIPRPKINPYGKAHCLTIDQACAFLHSIPRWTLQGKHDYALFLAYLATGRRNSEIRTLQMKDFEIKGSVLTAKCFPTERPARGRSCK